MDQQFEGSCNPVLTPPRRRVPGRAWLGPSARKAPAEPVRRRACDLLSV